MGAELRFERKRHSIIFLIDDFNTDKVFNSSNRVRA